MNIQEFISKATAEYSGDEDIDFHGNGTAEYTSIFSLTVDGIDVNIQFDTTVEFYGFHTDNDPQKCVDGSIKKTITGMYYFENGDDVNVKHIVDINFTQNDIWYIIHNTPPL